MLFWLPFTPREDRFSGKGFCVSSQRCVRGARQVLRPGARRECWAWVCANRWEGFLKKAMSEASLSASVLDVYTKSRQLSLALFHLRNVLAHAQLFGSHQTERPKRDSQPTRAWNGSDAGGVASGAAEAARSRGPWRLKGASRKPSVLGTFRL